MPSWPSGSLRRWWPKVGQDRETFPESSDGAMNNLFAYGSLMYGQVWSALFGKAIAGESAKLNGYLLRQIKGDVYPVIFPGEGVVKGVLFRDVKDEVMSALDRFEGDLYRRVGEEVQIKSGRMVFAFTYVLRKRHYSMIGGDWNRTTFESRDLYRFLARYDGFSS